MFFAAFCIHSNSLSYKWMLYLDSLVCFHPECKPWFPKKLLGECYLGNFQKMHGLVKSKVENVLENRMLNTYDVLLLWKDW